MKHSPANALVVAAIRTILEHIGEDPDREGLAGTPDRVMRSYSELFSGYADDPNEILSTTFGEVGNYCQPVILKDIAFTSFCEHHMLPFSGVVHIAYIPLERVVGISKLARLVECFGRRLQIQERMTNQIAEAIEAHLKPLGTAVIVSAGHSCMSCRGVLKTGSSMVTTSVHGEFKDPLVYDRLLRLISMG